MPSVEDLLQDLNLSGSHLCRCPGGFFAGRRKPKVAEGGVGRTGLMETAASCRWAAKSGGKQGGATTAPCRCCSKAGCCRSPHTSGSANCFGKMGRGLYAASQNFYELLRLTVLRNAPLGRAGWRRTGGPRQVLWVAGRSRCLVLCGLTAEFDYLPLVIRRDACITAVRSISLAGCIQLFAVTAGRNHVVLCSQVLQARIPEIWPS